MAFPLIFCTFKEFPILKTIYKINKFLIRISYISRNNNFKMKVPWVTLREMCKVVWNDSEFTTFSHIEPPDTTERSAKTANCVRHLSGR